MKRFAIVGVSLCAMLALGLVLFHQSEASAGPETDGFALETSKLVELAKRCSTSSDCPNSKCYNRKCGGCSTSSDCKYGKCYSRRCGGCSTSSDCGGWGKCSSRRCGACSTSSDCGRWGSCRNRRCTRTPY